MPVYDGKAKAQTFDFGRGSFGNSKEKMINAAKQYKLPYRVYGSIDELSHMTGTEGKGIFGLTDENFAKVILSEIDRQSLEEEVF